MKMWKNKKKIISSCWFRSASFIFMSSNEIVQHATILLISHKQKHHSFVFFSKIYSRPFTTWRPQSIISHEQLCFLHSDKLSSMNWIIRKLLANTSLMINRLELIVWHPSLYIYIYIRYISECAIQIWINLLTVIQNLQQSAVNFFSFTAIRHRTNRLGSTEWLNEISINDNTSILLSNSAEPKFWCFFFLPH